MSIRIDAFISEIRVLPAFAAAAEADDAWAKHLGAIEFALHEIDRRADNDPAMIEIFDKVVAIVTDNAKPLRQRLLDLNEVLIPLRARLFVVRH
jgi:hypothetical protein